LPQITGGRERLLRAMRQFVLPGGCTFTPAQLYDAAAPLIALAVQEDVPDADLVDARLIVGRRLKGKAVIRANSEGIVAGGWLLGQVAPHYSKTISVELLVPDGRHIPAGRNLAVIRGYVANIVTAERILLNFLSRLSGIATMTWRCVQFAAGTNAVVTDTRKTMPGYRILDKYAVQCGGGKNHRLGLCDGVMIKDNHISAMAQAGIPRMVKRVRRSLARQRRELPIWVEVDRLDQLAEALAAWPDVILIDNMSLNQLHSAVAMRNEWFDRSDRGGDRAVPLLEASGGIDLSNIADVARAGVDRIAVGALTHSAPALDLSLELDRSGHDGSDEQS